MQLFKFFHRENTSKQQKMVAGFCEELLSENDFEAVLISLLWIYYTANASEAVQKQILAQGRCWSYANQLTKQLIS